MPLALYVKSLGVAAGGGHRFGPMYQQTLSGCPARLTAILKDERLRSVLAVALSDSPEAERARKELPALIARAGAADTPPGPAGSPSGARLRVVHGAPGL
ncbi:hypothetical protein ACPPVO_12680 [Dactylosporangium sp. McL0621]|uniref:hypothetical protein n=1 Tax=Dactylosporangium sp. McL0621 TaxID=3415678 RepID=UPI003CEEF3F7